MPSVLKEYNCISHLPFLRAKYELIHLMTKKSMCTVSGKAEVSEN